MNKRETETHVHQKTNTFPIIALLLANLLAVLLTMGILLVRTKSLVGSTADKISVDRIGEIKLDQGNVTFDLMNLDDVTNTPKVTQQVSMKQEDFLQGFSQMKGLVDKMVKAGLIKANNGGAAAPSE